MAPSLVQRIIENDTKKTKEETKVRKIFKIKNRMAERWTRSKKLQKTVVAEMKQQIVKILKKLRTKKKNLCKV